MRYLIVASICVALFGCLEPFEPIVVSVVVTPADVELVSIGETVPLTAVARDMDGEEISGKTFTWSSSDRNTVMVDSEGLATALGNGAATVVATCDGVTGSATITVYQRLAIIEVTHASATILVMGDTVTLSAAAFDARNNAIAGNAFSWSSSNQDIATVDSSGHVTAIAQGSVIITASIGETNGTAFITVVEPVERILFQREGDIWIMDPDGSNVLNLTDSPAYDAVSWEQSPWSPDGSRIAFTSDRDGNQEIYVTDIAGTTLINVTGHYASDILPHWSPDGTKLVFTRLTSGGSDVYVVNVDGTGATNLTYDNPGVDHSPAWSPDGTRIAFVSNRGGWTGLWLMRADGSNPSTLYPDSVQKFAWSPDGTQIAMQKPIGPGYTSEITVMNVADMQEDTLTINSDWDGLGSWSPDGTRIAFTGERDGIRSVFVINANGSGLRDLSFDSTTDAGSPTWSPDGEWIAFISSNPESDGDIWVIRPDGSGLVQLTNSPEWEHRPVWSP